MNEKEAKEDAVSKVKKPSPTATLENTAAAKKANTAKPQAKKPAEKAAVESETTESTKTISASDLKMKLPEKKPSEKKPEKKHLKEGELDTEKLTTVEETVAMYNEMVLTAIDVGVKHVTTVKSFDSLKTGLLACQRLHVAIQAAKNPSAKTKKEDTMLKKAKKTTTKKTAKKTGAKRSKFDPSMKITWLGKENPRREGSGRYDRIEGVRKASGKTVETYLKTGHGSTLAHCVKNKLAKVS